MDTLGEAISKNISDPNGIYALQIFIETLLTVVCVYILYKIVLHLRIYTQRRKRARSISDFGDVELMNVV